MKWNNINYRKDEKYKEYYEKEKAEYKLRLLSTDVEKIGENAYKITEKLEMSNEPIVKITYVKILKEGVYVIGNENSKDIFLDLSHFVVDCESKNIIDFGTCSL